MITVDLAGPAGNAWAILAQAETWRKQLATVDRDIEPISLDAGLTYTDLLDEFDRRFKGVVAYRFLNDPREPDAV